MTPIDLPAGVEHGVGQHAHQPDVAAAEDDADARRASSAPEHARRVGKRRDSGRYSSRRRRRRACVSGVRQSGQDQVQGAGIGGAGISDQSADDTDVRTDVRRLTCRPATIYPANL